MFAGHSLGEYAALAAVGGLFGVEHLIDIVFMRGLTMQKFVPRNAQGVSDYGMVAVNPGRVNKKFGIKDLEEVVDAINSKEELLQIVNYNVDPVQYVCAGHVRALMAMRLVLDEIQGTGCSNVAAIGKHAASAKFQSLDMLRGKATIPLKGIDVPFHSRMLLPGVDAFRKVIDGMVPKPLRTAKHFVDRYIPNVTGIPLECSREYLQIAVKKTDSKVLQEILASWTEGGKSAFSSREIIRTLIIELLAFQFASPVLWTKTVEEALCKAHVKRVIEFGPGPTLKAC
jgi:malonyl CoA-acyl carrier protein transacylase